MRKEKNATKIAQIEKRVDKAKEDMLQKDRLKNVSLGTSKINYPSPNPIPNPNQVPADRLLLRYGRGDRGARARRLS